MKDDKSGGNTESVWRASSLLSAFAAQRSPLALGQLSEICRLPKGSTHRLISTLVEANLLMQMPDGRYALGVRAWELGVIASSALDPPVLGSGAIDWLAEESGETVLIARADWSQFEVVIVEKREGSHPISVVSPLGARSTISERGCIGRALVAGLPDIERTEALRKHVKQFMGSDTASIDDLQRIDLELLETRVRGYAVDAGRYHEGVCGVGSWLGELGQRPFGAVCIVGPSNRLSRKRLNELGRLISRVAKERIIDE